MKFPNSLAGVKKIFIAEVLSLISVFASVMTVVFAYFLSKTVDANGQVTSDGAATAGFGGVAIFGLAMTVLAIIAIIFSIQGTRKGSLEEPAFKMAFYAIIASLIITVVEGIITSFVDNTTIANIFSIVGDIVSIMITVFIIQAIINLAGKLGDTAMQAKGNNIYKIIIGVYVLQIIAKIVTMITGSSSKTGKTISGILLIVAAVLDILQYVLYLIYLNKAKKMLAA